MDNEQKNKSIKKFLLKVIIAFLLALGMTFYFYWPIYQKIPLDGLRENIDIEVSELRFPLDKVDDDIKEILEKKIDLPIDRYELCLKNKNRFHFFHADSNTNGIPFLFYTEDLNQGDYGKKNKLGSMAIKLYYNNNLPKDENYSEFGQPRNCIKLSMAKLKNYASSTIEYSSATINRTEEFELGTQGKLVVRRPVIRGYFINTNNSYAYIIARWEFFILTFVVLFGFFLWLIKCIQKRYGLKRSNNMANI